MIIDHIVNYIHFVRLLIIGTVHGERGRGKEGWGNGRGRGGIRYRYNLRGTRGESVRFVVMQYTTLNVL